MAELLQMLICIFMWIISQSVIYVFLYYNYVICKNYQYRLYFKNSKFFCYVLGFLITIVAMRLISIDITSIISNENIIISSSFKNTIIFVFIGIFVISILYLLELLLDFSIKSSNKVNFYHLLNCELKKNTMSKLDLITVVLIAPCIEEFVFRGGLYERLTLFVDRGASVLIVGITFGILHLQPKKILFSFIASILFSICYVSGGLIASIVSHAFYNFISTYLIEINGVDK